MASNSVNDFRGTQIGGNASGDGGFIHDNDHDDINMYNDHGDVESGTIVAKREGHNAVGGLLPLTIKQIANAADPAPDRPFLIDGKEVNQVMCFLFFSLSFLIV